MAPIVLIIQGLVHKDWKDAFLFSVAVAVGLTPEMLPMIVVRHFVHSPRLNVSIDSISIGNNEGI
jgi:Mg2+-importing ATPase